MDGKLKERYAEIIKSKDIILLATAGSEVLGLSTGKNSDKDEVGIYIEPMSEIAGFGSEQHVVWRSAEARTGKVGEPSKAGDVDLTLYGLRKFLRLALGGNPSILNVLYTPEKSCSILTDVGKELLDLKKHIVSRQAGKAFMGYLNQQRLRLLGSVGQMRVNRPDVIQEHGFDTKYAMHMIRLGMQGKELLETGDISVPLTQGNIDFLRDVRAGAHSKATCLDEAAVYERYIKQAMDTSPLPSNPNFDLVEAWMLKVYRAFWR